MECEYQLHAFNKLQRREQDRRRESLVAGAVLIAAMLLAVVFVVRFVRHELARETQQLKVLAAAEHQERELLETRLQQQQTERENEVLLIDTNRNIEMTPAMRQRLAGSKQ